MTNPGAFAARTVVLTGVGRPGQVGEAVARAFFERGAECVLLDRDPAVHERALALGAGSGRVTGEVCDLADADAVSAAAARVGAAHPGGVHALVNLAGGFAMSGPLAGADPAVLHQQLAISLVTAWCTTRAFLPLLRVGRGAVVFFGAASVLPGGVVKGMSAYAAAKAGVLALMQAVAQEERDTGVRANAVAPTAVRTAANTASMGDTVRYVEREAVADVVCYLCSDESRAITGQVVRLA
ncbi:MAG: SDR family oxidoreductase [Gemmatimonadetes bacterium]|nr:SDR family oxidoreductase [Gemmatimonadota bacterium]